MTKKMSRAADELERRAPSPEEARKTADYLCDQMRMSAQALHLTIPPNDVCSRVRVALENASGWDESSMDALRESVCDFTAVLRDIGTSAEAILVSLKAVVNIHALPATSAASDDRTGHRMQERMSGWAIEEFFKGGQTRIRA
jgi:hypothetical protein